MFFMIGGDKMSRPLDGIRVIDLSSGPVGGYATTVLSDFGADVIKVERPGGDSFRDLPAWPLWLRGKRSIEIDLAQSSGRAELIRLVRGADVVLSSFSPGRAERMGIGCKTLMAENPALIHASITGFGPGGSEAHLPGYEGIVTARTGRLSIFSDQKKRQGPVFAALGVASHAAAQGAVQGILAALLEREESGQGHRIETSLAQGTLPYDLGAVLIRQLQDRDPLKYGEGTGLQMPGLPTLNYHPVQCRDGRWIQLGNLLEHLFLSFLDAVDLLPDLIQDERFMGDPVTWPSEFVEDVRCQILERMLEKDADVWMEIFREQGGVAAEIWAPASDALGHPDLVGNGDVVESHHPTLGGLKQIGPIAQLGATPGFIDLPAPRAGEHTEEVASDALRSLHLSPTAHRKPRGRPLDGVIIIELGTIIATPLGVSMLADLGARVIKVEPMEGDPFRALGVGGFRGLFANRMNQGKESMCLNLKSPEGRGVLKDLVKRAHAVIHNFRPGVPEKLGVDYESLKAIRPNLVWVALNGYGPDSPGANRPATHPVAGAAMGGSWIQAGRGMPPKECNSMGERVEAARQLIKANEANPDPNTAVILASATLLALLAQKRFGLGQTVHVNMLTANAWANADDMVQYDEKLERVEVDSDLRGFSACYRLYQARQGWVFLALVKDREWVAFCKKVGREEWLSDPRFSKASARRAHDNVLAIEIERIFEQATASDWQKVLTPSGVPCVEVEEGDPADFFVWGEHALANHFSHPVHHPRYGDFLRWGPLVTCDGGMESYEASPVAGAQTDALLEELGRSPSEIEGLRSAGVVASAP
ncbi:MAG: hypothetical protein CL917_14635 [Deltaproteobacteria bacterium]|nr:hypothetical protein [Deltaproteobacteria bacterium]